jgi:hypothetical protein
VAVGVNFTEQAPFKSLQVSLENLPELLFNQATLPVGVEPEPLTVALQVTAEPTTTEAGLQVRVVGEALTISVLHPLVAARLLASPL